MHTQMERIPSSSSVILSLYFVQVNLFGDMICMQVGAEETMEQLAGRIQRRLGVADEEFAKWKFCHVKDFSTSAADWLEPSDIVTEKFPKQSSMFGGFGEQSFLGLVHSVTHAKRATTRTHNLQERSIKIN